MSIFSEILITLQIESYSKTRVCPSSFFSISDGSVKTRKHIPCSQKLCQRRLLNLYRAKCIYRFARLYFLKIVFILVGLKSIATDLKTEKNTHFVKTRIPVCNNPLQSCIDTSDQEQSRVLPRLALQLLYRRSRRSTAHSSFIQQPLKYHQLRQDCMDSGQHSNTF